MSIQGYQIRAARGYMNWTRADLAREAGVSVETIKRIEYGQGGLLQRNEEAILYAFTERGIVFEEGGIRKMAKCKKCGVEQHGA